MPSQDGVSPPFPLFQSNLPQPDQWQQQQQQDRAQQPAQPYNTAGVYTPKPLNPDHTNQQQQLNTDQSLGDYTEQLDAGQKSQEQG